MKEKQFENSEKAKQIASFKLPRYEELAKFDLIMNQMVDFIDNLKAGKGGNTKRNVTFME